MYSACGLNSTKNAAISDYVDLSLSMAPMQQIKVLKPELKKSALMQMLEQQRTNGPIFFDRPKTSSNLTHKLLKNDATLTPYMALPM